MVAGCHQGLSGDHRQTHSAVAGPGNQGREKVTQVRLVEPQSCQISGIIAKIATFQSKGSEGTSECLPLGLSGCVAFKYTGFLKNLVSF